MDPLPYIHLADDFPKTSFEPQLQCGNQTCLHMSLAESKICKPLVKQKKKVDEVVFFLLILYALSICLMVSFDLTSTKLTENSHQKPIQPISKIIFVLIFAAVIIYLTSGTFDKALFCSMNMKEKICEKQVNYRHEGALHTIEDPIYVSAPCKIFPLGGFESRNSEILNINQTISPCTLELRSNFFIEKFEMDEMVNSNDFVLLDEETLEFAFDLEFTSWSKQGSTVLHTLFSY